MHIIQIVRLYLGLTQKELAQRAGIGQPDLCEMEIKEPYGRIDKYKRLSDYLSIPVHALVTNNCNLIPAAFFEKHPPRPYFEEVSGLTLEVGRAGEDTIFQMEQQRLAAINPSLSKLVLPFYKLRHRPGYDILSFDDNGKPVYIEVKTSQDDSSDFTLTKQEYVTATKAVDAGEDYQIFRLTKWGSPDQKLTVYHFSDLTETHEISPATYIFSAAAKSSVISGITYCREQRGMSKGELADCLGIQTPHLWRYENGVQSCSVGIYKKMADILNVSIDQLLEEHRTC